jgi:LmbE family N-acetylglucosaminyl deacetylase
LTTPAAVRTLAAVFAHPDDETFATGGTLAKYAEAGARCSLYCATDGGGRRLCGRARW